MRHNKKNQKKPMTDSGAGGMVQRVANLEFGL